MKHHAAKGHTHKHTSAHKHSGTKKHNPGKHHPGHGKKGPKTSPGPLVVAQHPKHPKARKLARVPAIDQGDAQRGLLRLCLASGGEAEPRQPPGASPCLADWDACTAIALGASLRLAGWPVTDEDVLALHVAAGGSRDTGVSILAGLQTAARDGLAGVRPRGFESVGAAGAHDHDDRDFTGHPGELLDVTVPLGQQAAALSAPETVGPFFAADDQGHMGSAILGAELPAGWYSPQPGPHALVLDGPGVWSWGEWHPWGCFPGAVVEECWRVVWP